MKWLLFISMLGFASTADKPIKVYTQFAAFEKDYLTNLDSDTTYIINFWATWCAPCVKELPYFEQYGNENADKPVKLILVSLDFKGKEEQVKNLVQKKGLQSEVVMLADGKASEWIDKISPEWSGAIPATLVIKNNGRHFYEKSYESYEELTEELNNIE